MILNHDFKANDFKSFPTLLSVDEVCRGTA